MTTIPLTIPFGSQDFTALFPCFIVACGALLVLLLDLLFPASLRRGWSILIALATLGIAGVSALNGWGEPISVFANAFVTGSLTVAFEEIVVIGAALSLLLMYTAGRDDQAGGAIALLLWSASGAMLMAGASNLMVVFLGLELLSLGLYCLCGFVARRVAREAALKYLLLSSTASAVMLYGMALLFGATGSVDFNALALPSASPVMFDLGVGLFLVGLAFKLSLVPFHEWTPDVYAGAPLPVTAFMSVVTKAGALAVLIRFLGALPPNISDQLVQPLWVVAGLSMIVGNVGALAQTDLKRLLAYSGIAQLGYIVAALAVRNDNGLYSAIFYLAAYTFMNLGAFAVAALLSRDEEEGTHLASFRGLSGRKPLLAGAMTFFLLGLAGIPPTAGFTGKVLILANTIGAGFVNLAVLLVIGTAISFYAYLKIVRLMYAPSVGQGVNVVVPRSRLPWIAIAVCAVAILVLALHPVVPAGSFATLKSGVKDRVSVQSAY